MCWRTNLTGAFLLDAGRAAPHAQEPLGPDHQHLERGRAHRPGRPGELRGLQGGLIGFTRSMAREVASRGITVNAVAPGYIETPMTAVLSEEQRKSMMASIPLGRPGTDARNGAIGRVSGLRCGRLHHRPRARRERRHVHGLMPCGPFPRIVFRKPPLLSVPVQVLPELCR